MSYKRILLSLGTIAVVAAVSAGVTGAFFTDTAQSNGNTFNSGSLNLQMNPAAIGGSGFQDSFGPGPTPGYGDLTPGGDEADLSTQLKNNGSSDAAGIGLAVANNNNSLAQRMRITELAWKGESLLEGGAGAAISEYEAPNPGVCTSTVTPGSLNSTVSSVAAGDIVCIDTGSYTPGTLTIDKDNVTIVGLNDPNGPDKATVQGQLEIDADGVTVKGLEWTGAKNTYGVRVEANDDVTITHNVFADIGTTLNPGSVQAIYYNAGDGNTSSSFTAANVEFSQNRFSNIGNTNMLPPNSGSSAKAIYIGDTEGDGEITGVTVAHNVIDGVFVSDNTYANGGRGGYGFMVNFGGNTKDLVVEHNSIENLSGWWSTAIGLEGRTQDAVVEHNDIGVLGSASGGDTGVNFESNTSAGSVSVDKNNFDTTIDGVIINPNFSSFNGTVDATNNWWGDFDPSDQIIENNGTVDTSNFAGGPFIGLINGTDNNNNGFADLDDLRRDAITNATPGLNAGETAQLDFTVQLDGPTTDNSFMNQTLNSDFEFTLGQLNN